MTEPEPSTPVELAAESTRARARLVELRQQRQHAHASKVDALVEKLDALASQCYVVIRASREHLNVLRLLAIDAKQTVLKLRKSRKPDVEI